MAAFHDPAHPIIEQFGLHTERSGLTRIAGRLMGFLLLNGEAHSLDELAEHLQVSKASISTNARLLEQQGIVERIAHPGDRRDFYRISENPWEQMFAIARTRMEETRRICRNACTALPPEYEGAHKRLAEWISFNTFLLENLEEQIARWHKQHAA